MRIESYIQASARRDPRKTALVCGRRRWDYARLDAISDDLARKLSEGGVRRGDRVAVFLPNGVEAVTAVFAVLKAGAVLVMLNPSTKAEKLAFVLHDSQAAAVVLPARKLDMIESPAEELPYLRLAVTTNPRKNADEEENSHFTIKTMPAAHGVCRQLEEDDLAAVLYTSGSSGRPKGVMLSHANVAAAVDAICAYLQNTADDVILSVLSLSFGYGLTQLLTAFKAGATLVLEESFTYSHAVMKRFEEERATGFAMVPTVAAILLQMDLSKYDLHSLRYVTNAGAALPAKHVTALRNVLPWVKIYLMYGQTECIRASYLPPEMIDERPESVGRGMPGVAVFIVDAEGRPSPPGEIGELVVQGENVMQGYWGLPQENEKVLRSDERGKKLLYTGDLFTADADGFLRFVARKDDIIKTKGEKVSPMEVEDVLHSHPDVAAAAVFGAPDAILGQAVHAAVVLRRGSSLKERDVQLYCSRHLEDFMVPQEVRFLDELPQTPNGKINKQELMGAVQS